MSDWGWQKTKSFARINQWKFVMRCSIDYCEKIFSNLEASRTLPRNNRFSKRLDCKVSEWQFALIEEYFGVLVKDCLGTAFLFFLERLSYFLILIISFLYISFSRELIVRNFTWDPCIPACWNGWVNERAVLFRS